MPQFQASLVQQADDRINGLPINKRYLEVSARGRPW